MKYIFIFLIKIYKTAISPFLPNSCRFYPTCSEYSSQALMKHGAVKGLILSVWRVLRCNPYNKGGFDPVPDTFSFTKRNSESVEVDKTDGIGCGHNH